MRPLKLGHYEDDLAGLQRFRRRVVQDSDQSLDWKRDMLKRVDGLIERVNRAVSDKLTTAKKTGKKRVRTRSKTHSASAESG